MKNYNIPAHQK